MICGFTGTSQQPLTAAQRKRLQQLLWKVEELHLGDCVNADAEAYDIAASLGISTIGHPPVENRRRANCTYTRELPPRPFLARNHDIVDAGVDGLIACPRGFIEVKRSGTWATIRYAVKLQRNIWIILPDGSVKVGL